MRVAMLVSDHGWGHLGRSLVVGEAFLARDHALLCVVSEAMAPRVREALPAAEVQTGRLDQGYVFGAGGRGADAEQSRARLAACAGGPDAALAEAVVGWRPDVVLADATPWASTVASRARVPAVLCSNFSWDDQFTGLYAGAAEAAADLAAVRGQVAAFDLALELPLGPGAPTVPRRERVPLVSQRPSGAVTGLPDGQPVVTWAFGRTPPAAQPLEALRALAQVAAEHGCVLAVNEGLREVVPQASLLPDDARWPDVLAASRLVVSKAGYSTLAEALRGPAFLISMGVTGLPEERAMQAEIEARGLGLAIGVDEPDTAAAMVSAARTLLGRASRAPILEAGEGAIVDAVERLVASAGR